MSVPPKDAGIAGQFSVTTKRAVFSSGQVVDAVFVTSVKLQLSLAVAMTVLLMEQASSGVVNVTVKPAEAPDARLGKVSTVLGED